MVRNYKKVGQRGSTEFFITLNNVDWKKSLTGEWFRNDILCSELCVAEEDYSPPLDCDTGEPVDGVGGKHHHIYLKMSEPVCFDYLQDIIKTLCDENGFDLQACKSRKSCLIYITKSDSAPFLFNVLVKDLSFYCRANYYVKTTYKSIGVIDKSDSFMVGAGNFRNVVIDMAEKHMGVIRDRIVDSRVTLDPNMVCGVTKSIVSSFMLGCHLFIFGLPGTGKTELIDRLIKDKKVYRCGMADRFMFGGLSEIHDILLFEDYRCESYRQYLSTILSIMDKKPVSISAKYAFDKIMIMRCQVVFISNEVIPHDMAMLERRLDFFSVTHRMYECDHCIY